MSETLHLLEERFREGQNRHPLYRCEVTFRDGWGPRIPRYSVRTTQDKTYLMSTEPDEPSVELTDDAKIRQYRLNEEAFWEFRRICTAVVASEVIELVEGERATADGRVLFWALGNTLPRGRDSIWTMVNAFMCVADAIRSTSRAALPVAQVLDDSAYVVASTLWRDRFPTYNKCREFLEGQTEIRHKQRGQRRLIHAGDWARYWAARNHEAFAACDSVEPDSITDVDVQAFVESAKKRQKDVRGKRKK